MYTDVRTLKEVLVTKEKKRVFKLDTVKESQLDDTKIQHVKDALNKATTAQEPSEEPEPAVDNEIAEMADEEMAEHDPLGLEAEEDFAPAVDMFAENLKKAQETLMSKEHQEAIKNLCKPLSVADMLRDGEFRQIVPIIKDEFEVEFRSTSTAEDLELKKIMADVEIKSQRHFMDLYTAYQQAVGVVAVNGNSFPSHLDKQGNLDKDLLESKLKYILTMPVQMAAVLGVHLYWFDQRVRELFDIERTISELKNG